MNIIGTAVFGQLARGKPVFTTADVRALTDSSPVWIARSLTTLSQKRLITKVRRGIWAFPHHDDFSPYSIVPDLLRATDGSSQMRGYVSLLSALNLHGMIDQVPRVIHIVAEKSRPAVHTPFGTYEFHQMQSNLIGGYGPYRNTGNFDIATPAKALFDTLYLSARRGRKLRHFPEVSLPKNFSRGELRGWIGKIEERSLRAAVVQRWDELRRKIEGD